jgi:hypothetical protein
MKTVRFVVILAFLMPLIGAAQTNQHVAGSLPNDKIEAYYFHFSARCVTCKTVEAEAKKDIESLYPEKVKSGKMSFQAINLDEASSKAIAEKLNISGQTLLLVKGNQQINITNEGFLYAVTDPDKLKSIIKTKVDGLLKL